MGKISKLSIALVVAVAPLVSPQTAQAIDAVRVTAPIPLSTPALGVVPPNTDSVCAARVGAILTKLRSGTIGSDVDAVLRSILEDLLATCFGSPVDPASLKIPACPDETVTKSVLVPIAPDCRDIEQSVVDAEKALAGDLKAAADAVLTVNKDEKAVAKTIMDRDKAQAALKRLCKDSYGPSDDKLEKDIERQGRVVRIRRDCADTTNSFRYSGSIGRLRKTVKDLRGSLARNEADLLKSQREAMRLEAIAKMTEADKFGKFFLLDNCNAAAASVR
jgi:hypothetical protein